jgi:hypothetical protein
MYADDADDWFAWPNWDNKGARIPGWLYTRNTSGQVPNPDSALYKPPRAAPDSAWRTGKWFDFMPNSKSFLCPVDIRRPSYLATGPTGRKNKLSSYVMNGAPCGYADGEGQYNYKTTKIGNVWSPLCWLMWEPDENALGPGNPGADAYNDGANEPTDREGVGRLHSKKGGMILAVGGHTQFITEEEFRADSSTPAGQGMGKGGKTYLYWSTYTAHGRK